MRVCISTNRKVKAVSLEIWGMKIKGLRWPRTKACTINLLSLNADRWPWRKTNSNSRSFPLFIRFIDNYFKSQWVTENIQT